MNGYVLMPEQQLIKNFRNNTSNMSMKWIFENLMPSYGLNISHFLHIHIIFLYSRTWTNHKKYVKFCTIQIFTPDVHVSRKYIPVPFNLSFYFVKRLSWVLIFLPSIENFSPTTFTVIFKSYTIIYITD